MSNTKLLLLQFTVTSLVKNFPGDVAAYIGSVLVALFGSRLLPNSMISYTQGHNPYMQPHHH